jgi:hypothetical protein
MMPPRSAPDPIAALTPAEKQRGAALLASVSSHTLLNVLATLCNDHEDAAIIIAALLDRLPADARTGPD